MSVAVTAQLFVTVELDQAGKCSARTSTGDMPASGNQVRIMTAHALCVLLDAFIAGLEFESEARVHLSQNSTRQNGGSDD